MAVTYVKFASIVGTRIASIHMQQLMWMLKKFDRGGEDGQSRPEESDGLR